MTEQPPVEKKSFSKEYMAFLIAFGIIGLAIAFVIGQAASRLVTAFVNDTHSLETKLFSSHTYVLTIHIRLRLTQLQHCNCAFSHQK